jgi:hypothetical protein
VERIQKSAAKTEERGVAGALPGSSESIVKDEALIGSVRDLIEDCLREGAVIDIDGIGTLGLDASGDLTFKRNGRTRVFLAYAQEDRRAVKRLYEALQRADFEPWMDTENLLPGQNWPRAIERAIELSDYFVGCFSSRSTGKRGHFQSELSYALDVATRVPSEQAYFVPLRLEECEMPAQIVQRVHYVDLWPDWQQGFAVLTKALRAHEKRRNRNLLTE